eukprot:scaffold7328_cov314-Pinguiococcus_pyrenoidosus.AAC.75
MPQRQPAPRGCLDPRLGVSDKMSICETCNKKVRAAAAGLNSREGVWRSGAADLFLSCCFPRTASARLPRGLLQAHAGDSAVHLQEVRRDPAEPLGEAALLEEGAQPEAELAGSGRAQQEDRGALQEVLLLPPLRVAAGLGEESGRPGGHALRPRGVQQQARGGRDGRLLRDAAAGGGGDGRARHGGDAGACAAGPDAARGARAVQGDFR